MNSFPKIKTTVDGLTRKPEDPPNESIQLGLYSVYLWLTVSVILSVVSLCLSVYTALNR